MFPSLHGGWYVLAAIIAAVVAAWIFLPQGWAVGITVGIGAVFLGVFFYVAANTRFT